MQQISGFCKALFCPDIKRENLERLKVSSLIKLIFLKIEHIKIFKDAFWLEKVRSKELSSVFYDFSKSFDFVNGCCCGNLRNLTFFDGHKRTLKSNK